MDIAGPWGTAERYRAQALASCPHLDPKRPPFLCASKHDHILFLFNCPHCLHQFLTQEVPGDTTSRAPPLQKLPLGDPPGKNTVSCPCSAHYGTRGLCGHWQKAVCFYRIMELVLWALSILGCARSAQGLSRRLRTACLGAAVLSQQPLLDIHGLTCCLLLLALRKSKHY